MSNALQRVIFQHSNLIINAVQIRYAVSVIQKQYFTSSNGHFYFLPVDDSVIVSVPAMISGHEQQNLHSDQKHT